MGFETHLGKFSKLEQPSPHLISVYILYELRCVGDANKFPSLRFRRTAFGMLVEETKNRAVKPVMTCPVSQ